MLSSKGMLLIVVALMFAIGVSAFAKTRRKQQLQTGQWGGMHIRLNVEGGSVNIDYDCANGRIDGPLTIDSRGRFRWYGTHQREHGGPVRQDETGNDAAATYTGWIKGDTMNLTVTLTDSKQVVGTYTLTRGAGGRVFKCK